MGRLRPLVVAFWRWFTGPASVVAVLAVALYLLSVTAGPPLLALWLIVRALIGNNETAVGSLALLGVQVIALALAWYLARRFLPPFRWRA
jgi:hypothetical protein